MIPPKSSFKSSSGGPFWALENHHEVGSTFHGRTIYGAKPMVSPTHLSCNAGIELGFKKYMGALHPTTVSCGGRNKPDQYGGCTHRKNWRAFSKYPGELTLHPPKWGLASLQTTFCFVQVDTTRVLPRTGGDELSPKTLGARHLPHESGSTGGGHATTTPGGGDQTE